MSTTKDNLARQIYFACGQHELRASWSNPHNHESVRVEIGTDGLYSVSFWLGLHLLSAMGGRTLFDAAEDVEKWIAAGCTFPY